MVENCSPFFISPTIDDSEISTLATEPSATLSRKSE